LRAILRYCQDVLEPNPELTVLINPGLIAERHSRLENYLTAAHQVWPLVALQSNAVAEPMSEGAIVGSVAGVGDDFAGDGVHFAALLARSGKRDGLALRLV